MYLLHIFSHFLLNSQSFQWFIAHPAEPRGGRIRSWGGGGGDARVPHRPAEPREQQPVYHYKVRTFPYILVSRGRRDDKTQQHNCNNRHTKENCNRETELVFWGRQASRSAETDLILHCLLRPHCPSIKGN